MIPGCDRQTDRQTALHMAKSRSSIAERDNEMINVWNIKIW